tara:strand:- start:3668 stop:5713 length:2046 start_codon:yes stop_codon:yes gene_type:complete
MDRKPQIALLGNPNSGKTAVFNQLTGLSQKVSNYPGVTVEKHIGKISISESEYDLIDFPGIYGIIPNSLDEEIVCKEILGWCTAKETRPDLIVCVLDSSNISRNLYLATQIIELGIPTIFALNMIDLLQASNKSINIDLLKEKLNIFDAVTCCALNKRGLIDLTQSINSFFNSNYKDQTPPSIVNSELKSDLSDLKTYLKDLGLSNSQSNLYSINIVSNSSSINLFENRKKIAELSESCKKTLEKNNITPQSLNSIIRYNWLEKLFKENPILIDYNKKNKESFTERVDKYLTHPIIGTGLFLGLLFLIFWSLFKFAEYPMMFVEFIMGSIKDFTSNAMSDGLLKDLMIDGVLSGIEGIVIFIPQILILMFSLKFLEDSGYMARASFLMDRFMSKIGLHGGSVLPLMSGYACAIPGIMAARTIDDWKERLITILVLPLTSCTARLPVYIIMITAFIEDTTTQTLLFMLMYFLGTITAIIVAKILSIFLKEKKNPSFIMELPSYKIPIFKTLFIDAYSKTKAFVVDAGKIIFAISIILWVLASFPKDSNNDIEIENSYVGSIGKTIEPIIEPMGFDWRIGIGLITSFAARETFVATMNMTYTDLDEEDNDGLKEKLKKDYTPLIALSVMVFYVYAAQCMSTFAIVKRETNTWKWPAFMIIYMTLLAYVGSTLVFQVGSWIGYS